jgi:hypothetical protein
MSFLVFSLNHSFHGGLYHHPSCLHCQYLVVRSVSSFALNLSLPRADHSTPSGFRPILVEFPLDLKRRKKHLLSMVPFINSKGTDPSPAAVFVQDDSGIYP